MNKPTNQSDLETPLISWPCFEPAGGHVNFSTTDLTQHVLLVGSTGCGKTTLLASALDQLISVHTNSREQKLGLLVLDAKGDNLVGHLQRAAERAGRADDVMVFGPQGNCALDLFDSLNGDDANRLTRTVMLGVEKFGTDNTYWWQSTASMLTAAFTLLQAEGTPRTFVGIIEFLRRWFLSSETPPSILDLAGRLNGAAAESDPLLAAALDQVHLWQTLDTRTKSNLQTCLINVLQPLLSPAANRCFSPRHTAIGNPAQAVLEGKLCVVSINAPAEPDLARFLFRVAKQRFFDAVQQRQVQTRLCGLIADEFPLVVTREDIETLATVRSRNCFIAAAAQSLQSIGERIGVGPMHALVNNFNTVLFMRCREAETSVHAFVALGMRQETFRQRPKEEGGWLGILPLPSPEPIQRESPVCPMGALGLLAPHQAFIVFADGRRTETPVWFVPWFENSSRVEVISEKPAGNSSKFIEQLLLDAGFKILWQADLILQAAKLKRRSRRQTLMRIKGFFLKKCGHVPEGLEGLPDSWISALPGILWRSRPPHWTRLPYLINRVSIVDGLLVLEFAKEISSPGGHVTGFDRLRVLVNAGIYPSRVRPLSKWHLAKLRHLHPELRPTRSPDPDIR